MSERRFKGYNLDTKHGFFGTFTIWEFMFIFGCGILGGSFTSSSGSAPMIYSVISGVVALIVVLISKRTLAQKPHYYKHIYKYLNRPDYKHVKPDRDYVPVLPDAKQRRR